MAHIIEIVKECIGKNKTRQSTQKLAKVSDSQISRFIKGKAGLDAFALTRVILASGCKVYNSQGLLILGGSPEVVEKQINENFPPGQIAQETEL